MPDADPSGVGHFIVSPIVLVIVLVLDLPATSVADGHRGRRGQIT
jgi:hypothetical protein